MRRAGAGVSAFRHLLRAGALELDKLKRKVSKGGVEIEMTGAEFDLLELLLKRAGQVVSREEIAQLNVFSQLSEGEAFFLFEQKSGGEVEARLISRDLTNKLLNALEPDDRKVFVM